jgi:DNA-binding transcriptional regulator YdaS (Cro superfamily)
MTLDDYLKLPGAMSAVDLAALLNLKSPDLLRQWRHSYGGRKPSPENCVVIEMVTKGAVTRRDLRPDDWKRIWPELEATAEKSSTDGPKRRKKATARAVASEAVVWPPTQQEVDRIVFGAAQPPSAPREDRPCGKREER